MAARNSLKSSGSTGASADEVEVIMDHRLHPLEDRTTRLENKIHTLESQNRELLHAVGTLTNVVRVLTVKNSAHDSAGDKSSPRLEESACDGDSFQQEYANVMRCVNDLGRLLSIHAAQPKSVRAMGYDIDSEITEEDRRVLEMKKETLTAKKTRQEAEFAHARSLGYDFDLSTKSDEGL